MRRDQLKTPGLHNLQHVNRRLVDACIEVISFVEVLATRNTGSDTAETLAQFFEEMAVAARKPHGLKKKGKKVDTDAE